MTAVVDLAERRQQRDAHARLDALNERLDRLLLKANRELAERVCLIRLAEVLERFDSIIGAARPGLLDALAAALAAQVAAGDAELDHERALCLALGVRPDDLRSRVEALIDALPAELGRITRAYGAAVLDARPREAGEGDET